MCVQGVKPQPEDTGSLGGRAKVLAGICPEGHAILTWKGKVIAPGALLLFWRQSVLMTSLPAGRLLQLLQSYMLCY